MKMQKKDVGGGGGGQVGGGGGGRLDVNQEVVVKMQKKSGVWSGGFGRGVSGWTKNRSNCEDVKRFGGPVGGRGRVRLNVNQELKLL